MKLQRVRDRKQSPLLRGDPRFRNEESGAAVFGKAQIVEPLDAGRTISLASMAACLPKYPERVTKSPTISVSLPNTPTARRGHQLTKQQNYDFTATRPILKIAK
jgi:hypothetical protein